MRWLTRALTALILCGLSGTSLAGCRGAPLASVRYVGWVEPLEVLGGVLALPFTLLFDAATWGSFGLSWVALTLANPVCNGIDYDHSEVGFLEQGVVARAQLLQGQLDAAPEVVALHAASRLEAEGWETEVSGGGVSSRWRAVDQRDLRVVLELEELSPWRSAFELRLEVAGDVRDWTNEGDTWRARARLRELRQHERAADEEQEWPFRAPESKVGTDVERAMDPLPNTEWELRDRIFLRERELTRERLLKATPEDLTPLWEALRAEHGGSRLGE